LNLHQIVSKIIVRPLDSENQFQKFNTDMKNLITKPNNLAKLRKSLSMVSKEEGQ